MDPDAKFHWADYLVFALSLAISVVVGIIFAVREKWTKQSTESYLMADRKMNWILVGLSFWATVVSASFFIGLTTEFYYFGMTMIWVILARYIGGAFTIFFVIPKFFRLGFKITSAYEYFEHRFNLPVRMIVGVIFIVVELLSIAVTLYSPSLILAQVTGLSIYWCILIGACVCLIYTAFGGMKAVIWVDSIQVLIMVVGMCVLIVKGIQAAGGMVKVWEYYATIGERDNWADINPSPWDRHNVWNTLFLHALMFAGLFSTSQAVLQRYMTVPAARHAQWAVFLGITLGIGFTAIVILVGMAAFANVGGNEPMLNRPGQKPDEILAYFLMYLLGDVHGVPGLVVASLFAAGLSTLSSGQNALAAVLTKDFIQPIYKLCTKRVLKPGVTGTISKAAGIGMGVLTTLLCMVVPYFNDTLIQLSLSMNSFLTGPVLGLIIVAFFFFWVEAWGALVGLVCSIAWAVMVYAGAQTSPNRGLGMERRPLFNNNFSVKMEFPEPDVKPTFFDVSYTWYVLMDALVVMIISSIVSLIIHCVRNRGRLRGHIVKPSEDLRYTAADFSHAVKCRATSEEQRHDQEKVSPDDLENDDSDRDFCDIAVLEDIERTGNGVDNRAYENTKM